MKLFETKVFKWNYLRPKFLNEIIWNHKFNETKNFKWNYLKPKFNESKNLNEIIWNQSF